MPAVQETVDQVRRIDVDQYKYGFETLIELDKAPKGLSEDTVRFISEKKDEPEWMLAWRLDAYKRWLTMREPKWAKVDYGPIDYQGIYYYSAPKRRRRNRSTRSTRKFCAPTKSSAFRCASAKRCWASRSPKARRSKMKVSTAREVKTAKAMAALRSTRCSIRFRSPRPSRPSLRGPACCSCRSRRRSRSIRIW